MRVLVYGGRDFTDYEKVKADLDALHARHQIKELINGTARGADSQGDRWARENRIKLSRFPANWDRYGKSAGFKRNLVMAEQAPDLGIQYPGGRGTANMRSLLDKRDIPVWEPCKPDHPMNRFYRWWTKTP